MKIESGTYVPKEEIKNQEMLDNVVAAFDSLGFCKWSNLVTKFEFLDSSCFGVGTPRGMNSFFISGEFARHPISYDKLMELAGMSEEWPKVGDTVTWGDKSINGEVKAVCDGLAWVKIDRNIYVTEYVNCLYNPKTPEQLLREDIEKTLSGNPSLDYIIDALLENFNVTRK